MPIADKVIPFFERWMQKDDCEYLVTTTKGKHFDYRNYYDYYWKNVLAQIGIEHRPHDSRHTCVSMLTDAGIDDKIIKKIVGHRGGSVTEVVYNHFKFQKLIEAMKGYTKAGGGLSRFPGCFLLFLFHICVVCVSYLAKFHAAAHRFIY